MVKVDKATYLTLLFNAILSESLSNSLRGSYVLLISEFINIASILFYNYIEFLVLLYAFLVIFLLDTKNLWSVGFHLVSFQIYYLILLVQVLLAIFEVFV